MATVTVRAKNDKLYVMVPCTKIIQKASPKLQKGGIEKEAKFYVYFKESNGGIKTSNRRYSVRALENEDLRLVPSQCRFTSEEVDHIFLGNLVNQHYYSIDLMGDTKING